MLPHRRGSSVGAGDLRGLNVQIDKGTLPLCLVVLLGLFVALRALMPIYAPGDYGWLERILDPLMMLLSMVVGYYFSKKEK